MTPSSPERLQRAHRGFHGGARRETVVDQDAGAAPRIASGGRSPRVVALAPPELHLLAERASARAASRRPRYDSAAPPRSVTSAPPLAIGAHRKLGLPRQAKLAHDQHVERQARAPARPHGADRDAAARQAEHATVSAAPRIRLQCGLARRGRQRRDPNAAASQCSRLLASCSPPSSGGRHARKYLSAMLTGRVSFAHDRPGPRADSAGHCVPVNRLAGQGGVACAAACGAGDEADRDALRLGVPGR